MIIGTVAVIVAALAAPAAPAASATEVLGLYHPSRRELYTECRENGRTTSISDRCCRETADLQHSISFPVDGTGEKCSQFDATDFLANIETYCEVSPETGYANCTYDVKQDNSACAEQARATCQSDGGRVFASDFVLDCDAITMNIRNSLTCLGASCSHNDVQEYLWVGEFTSGLLSGLGSCQVASINGQTREERKREDTIHAIFGGLFLVGCVAFLIHRRRRVCYIPLPEAHPIAAASKARSTPAPVNAHGAEFA